MNWFPYCYTHNELAKTYCKALKQHCLFYLPISIITTKTQMWQLVITMLSKRLYNQKLRINFVSHICGTVSKVQSIALLFMILCEAKNISINDIQTKQILDLYIIIPIIGASPSKPHTSRKCVWVCIDVVQSNTKHSRRLVPTMH